MSSSVSEDVLNLSFLREQLIRQEETIIFNLIERAQWKQNKMAYQPGGVKFKNETSVRKSFLDFFFEETEKVHATVRRYTSPDENPFYPDSLPEPLLPLMSFSGPMHPNTINLNNQIMDIYLNKIIPNFFVEGDDGQYGSSVSTDIQVLQSLSKRIHFGKYVAEVKYREDPEGYSRLIEENNIEGIMSKLTNMEVERRLLSRVFRKASTYGQEPDTAEADKHFKIEPSKIEELYRDFVIPLTKEVEVLYLVERSKGAAVSFLGPSGTFSEQAAHNHFGKNKGIGCARFVACNNINEVFSNVLGNKTIYGIVPIENSQTGLVHTHMELLTSTDNIHVCGETYLPISFAFMVNNPSITLSQVERVHSHAQGFEQCKKWLETNCFGKDLTPTPSTAKGAELTSQDASGATACIANLAAGRNFGLHVLRDKIESSTTNITRFLVISRNFSQIPTGSDKTVILLDTENKPGALARVLLKFSEHGASTIDFIWK
eukprot:TRINITY_DN4716_c0_g1_i2.p1 TRINITY_DN4716_c0_g1~~TRINITY_DN4716_c0_g1_i2.p1  ORF type:complete len:488 (-),score=111.72 TRINITY_DN4716_c0_g1_i2:546-2009(-)